MRSTVLALAASAAAGAAAAAGASRLIGSRRTDLADATIDDHLDRLMERHPNGVAVIVLSLRDVDALEHLVGAAATDAARQSAAERMKVAAPDDAVVDLLPDGRVVVLVPRTSAARATEVADQLVRAADHRRSIRGREVRIRAAAGISVHPEDGGDASTLCRQADVAMRRAVVERSAVRHHDTTAAVAHVEQFELEQDLSAAMDRGELRLHYQPKIDVETGALVGVEGLVRWEHPSRGLLSPGHFLPLAERIGLIEDIDRWAIREGCAQLDRWHRGGVPVPSVAVNVSARTVQAGAVEEEVARALAATTVDPERLEIEITETELMTNPLETSAHLRILRRLGVRLAVDDFGTGYSSLGYLKNYEFDTLKIDRSFVVDLTLPGSPVTTADRAIVRSIVGLADGLGLRVIAEGVETEVQRDVLIELGCTNAQGHLYSPALSVEDLERQLSPAVTTTAS